MCSLYITSQYTAFMIFSSFDRAAAMHLLDMSKKFSNRSEHRAWFCLSRFITSGSWLALCHKFGSSGRSWLTGQYSAHAARNVDHPFPERSLQNIMLQFWQGLLIKSYLGLYSASNNQFCRSGIFRGWKCTIAFPRLCLRLMILWNKQIGLKKWLTAIEAPIKDLPVCDTLAKTMGLKVFLLESLLRWSFAASITRLAWSVLPLSLRSSIKSLNWNINRNKEPLTVTFLSAGTVIFINFLQL